MQDDDPRRPVKSLDVSSDNRISFADVCLSNRRAISNARTSKQGLEDVDCSIFEQPHGDALDPIPVGKPRTQQQQAALSAMLKESVQYLFPKTNGDAPMCMSSTSNQALRDPLGSENERQQRPVTDEYSTLRFRGYQTEAWDNRLKDLLRFKEREGHCSVPHSFPENPGLARWVKRQRFQYKLRQEGKSSTMTATRIRTLEDVGFVWDTHVAAWEERLSDLRRYRAEHGNCEVPTHYKANKKLATWVKCQRRQYKLYTSGRSSTINAKRVEILNRLGFSWEMRSYSKNKSTTS